MTKALKKIAASVMAVATLAVGTAGMSVSAGNHYSDFGTFTWSTYEATTINKTTSTRRITAAVSVYKDSNGAYVTTKGDDKRGGYNTTANASVSATTYPSSTYHFVLTGSIGNATDPNAGTAVSWSEEAN